jgi:hypothetical protein
MRLSSGPGVRIRAAGSVASILDAYDSLLGARTPEVVPA